MKYRIILEFPSDEEAETKEECLTSFLKGDFDIQDLQACGDLVARIDTIED